MTSERRNWIFLNRVLGLGGLRFHRLLEIAKSAEGILAMTPLELSGADVDARQVESWRHSFRNPNLWKAVDMELEREAKGEFQIVTELDEGYPAALCELSDRPPVLYLKGAWPLPGADAIAAVGTRKASPYGLKIAATLTEGLVGQGVSIISGLALGIDTVVHQSCLNKEGSTVAVLGHGFAHLYPKENKRLAEQIAENKGALVTEFPYDSPPEAFHFPLRNRIISGLSRGVVVVEAGERSGALITARYAAEQGRDVFAVPGNVFMSGSVGTHRLLKQGAKLVETAQDVLEEYRGADYERVLGRLAAAKIAMDSPPKKVGSDGAVLNNKEKTVYDKLICEPSSVDELSDLLKVPVDQLANTLLSLELRGLIRNLPGQRYVANNG